MRTKYEKVSTEELRFALGVGRAGLNIWPKSSPDYARVSREVSEMTLELRRRERPKSTPEQRAKARERHWRKTGVSNSTISWMKRGGWL